MTAGPNSTAQGGATLGTQGLFWGQSSPVAFLAADIVRDGAEDRGEGG